MTLEIARINSNTNYEASMDTRPYHRRFRPTPQDSSLFNFDRIDLTVAHLEPYPKPDPPGVLPDSRPKANSLFDGRAAAAVRASVGDPMSVRIEPLLQWTVVSLDHTDEMGRSFTEVVDIFHYVDDDGTLDSTGTHYNFGRDLLEMKQNNGWTPASPGSIRYVLRSKSLAVMAYADYFRSGGEALRGLVSEAIMKAAPGWCGTFGPAVTGAFSLGTNEGNYDMEQMFILPLVYNFYEDLTPEARERLITVLLAQGRIQRPNLHDTLTSGGAPNDWSRAGYVSPLGFHANIPETENHVLMIATARYLTNQLLYQRDHLPCHDNRRNGDPGVRANCMDQVLGNDFAEYNGQALSGGNQTGP